MRTLSRAAAALALAAAAIIPRRYWLRTRPRRLPRARHDRHPPDRSERGDPPAAGGSQGRPQQGGRLDHPGELAHEVAQDVPTDQDDQYYKISREAYEKALALDANNAGLKAAAQFARDEEAHAAEFDKARRQAARTYIDARRASSPDRATPPQSRSIPRQQSPPRRHRLSRPRPPRRSCRVPPPRRARSPIIQRPSINRSTRRRGNP